MHPGGRHRTVGSTTTRTNGTSEADSAAFRRSELLSVAPTCAHNFPAVCPEHMFASPTDRLLDDVPFRLLHRWSRGRCVAATPRRREHRRSGPRGRSRSRGPCPGRCARRARRRAARDVNTGGSGTALHANIAEEHAGSPPATRSHAARRRSQRWSQAARCRARCPSTGSSRRTPFDSARRPRPTPQRRSRQAAA